MAQGKISDQGIIGLLQAVGARDNVFDGMECMGEDDFGTELVQVLQECGKSTNTVWTAQCLERVREIGSRKAESLYKYYSIVATAILSHRNMKPNAAFTLYGPNPDCGATYACNEFIPLTPRTSNTVETDFEFNRDQMFFQLVTGEVDTNNGWKFRAGSVKFKGDVVSTMLNDVSFDVFEDKADGLDSPLNMYMYRWPGDNVPFSAQAYHSRTQAQELIQGATIMLLDRSCRNVSRQFGDSLFELDFAGAVLDMMRIHRQACRRPYSFGNIGNTAKASPIIIGS